MTTARQLRRALLALALTLAVAASATGRAAPAFASARHCDGHRPLLAADYQAVADSRSRSFGVGDITSMVRLPDGRRFVSLGDTGYYDVRADGSPGPLAGFGNNSAWVLAGDCFTLYDRAGPGPRSWILPLQRDGSVYWPGASVVVGSRLYVFLARLFLDNPFGTPVGSALAEFDLPSLQLARITPVPFTHGRIYGVGAVHEGPWVYLYASQAGGCGLCFAGSMYVARVREDLMQDPTAWRYRAGSSWVTDRNAAQPVLEDAVSNVDVQRYGNGYLLVTKPLSIVSPDVEARWSPNPVGPWRDLGTIYSIPQPPPSYVPGFTYAQSYTYNPVVLASAHLSDGGVLMSYDVNSFSTADFARDGRMPGPRFVSVHLPPPPDAPPRPPTSAAPSPWAPTLAVQRSGIVRTTAGGVGTASSHTARAVAVARTPTGRGGWVAASDGGVFAFGDAGYYGSMGGRHLNRPIVGIAATPTGHGYWLVASDGGIFTFGDAQFLGSTGGMHLNRPIFAMASTPTGNGYWLVASDGGIFTFGDAQFLGSTGGAPPVWPISGMAVRPDGRGYWLVTLAGQVYAFGESSWHGNASTPLAAPVVGIVAAPGGYRLVDTAGTVFVRAGANHRTHVTGAGPFVGAG